MFSPIEHKTVQSRILKYAQEIGWIYIDRTEAEKRRGFDADVVGNGLKPFPTQNRCRTASHFFEDLLYAKVKEFNPRYQETEGSREQACVNVKRIAWRDMIINTLARIL